MSNNNVVDLGNRYITSNYETFRQYVSSIPIQTIWGLLKNLKTEIPNERYEEWVLSFARIIRYHHKITNNITEQMILNYSKKLPQESNLRKILETSNGDPNLNYKIDFENRNSLENVLYEYLSEYSKIIEKPCCEFCSVCSSNYRLLKCFAD